MSSLIIYLHDYDVLVLVLGDGGADDRRGDVILSWTNPCRFIAGGFLGGE